MGSFVLEIDSIEIIDSVPEGELQTGRELHEHILDLFADRATVTKAFIRKNWLRTDWWIGADTALKHGFIDKVL